MRVFAAAAFIWVLVWGYLFFLELRRRIRPAKALETPVDYGKCAESVYRTMFVALISSSVGFCTGYVFYANEIAGAACSLLFMGYLHYDRKRCIERRRFQLNLQFKNALIGISASLAAGKSVENAVLDACGDLKWQYPNENTDINREFRYISRLIGNGETIENAFHDLAIRSQSEDIANFADVFRVCKRSGGDMVDVVRRTAAMIGDKLEMEQQIRVTLAQKRFESTFMYIIPPVLIAVLLFSSPGYMSPLYKGYGRFVMSLALAFILICIGYAQKILGVHSR